MMLWRAANVMSAVLVTVTLAVGAAAAADTAKAPSAVTVATTEAAEPLRNHYNDPFVQVTKAIVACPTPRGPFMTVEEAKAEAHPRIERGTTCFMSGKCSEPNAYRYDARIAAAATAAAEHAIKRTPALGRSSVWLTVQRRFIFVQGCVSRSSDVARWEALLRAVPEVQYVGADLAVVNGPLDAKTLPRSLHIPYPVMPPGVAGEAGKAQ